MKLEAQSNHQGTYTLQADTEKITCFLLFTGVSALLLKPCQKTRNMEDVQKLEA